MTPGDQTSFTTLPLSSVSVSTPVLLAAPLAA